MEQKYTSYNIGYVEKQIQKKKKMAAVCLCQILKGDNLEFKFPT